MIQRLSPHLFESTGEVFSFNRGEIVVKPSGENYDSYWCSTKDHTFCGGYAKFIWEGEDQGGHPIRIDVKVLLSHDACPGSTP